MRRQLVEAVPAVDLNGVRRVEEQLAVGVHGQQHVADARLQQKVEKKNFKQTLEAETCCALFPAPKRNEVKKAASLTFKPHGKEEGRRRRRRKEDTESASLKKKRKGFSGGSRMGGLGGGEEAQGQALIRAALRRDGIQQQTEGDLKTLV